MNRRGFILLEILVASSLLSLAGGGVYRGMALMIKTQSAVQESAQLNGPFRILWMQASKDLRNTVTLRGEPFIGTQNEIVFPVSMRSNELFRVHYFLKDGQFLRTLESLPERFVKEKPAPELLLKNLESLRLEYAYLDAEERIVFQPLWLEEPYFGIPKAVRITAKTKGSSKSFSRMIVLPQGRWGKLDDK